MTWKNRKKTAINGTLYCLFIVFHPSNPFSLLTLPSLSNHLSILSAFPGMANSISRHASQPPEDWDHPESTTSNTAAPAPSRVVFPSQGGCSAGDAPASDAPEAPSLTPRTGRSGKRTLSELLKLHAEKGTDVHFTAEEATRLEELLGQWINSGSSPYEGEDDFFPRSQDDSIVLVHRSSTFHRILGHPPHGQGESIALES